MERDYFLTTDRVGFSTWNRGDEKLAASLWGDPQVTKYICSSGIFSASDISKRLTAEITNEEAYGIQYWPVFSRLTGELIGCCGLRPHEKDVYEIGFHLRHNFWGQGYAQESAKAVIAYAFEHLHAKALFAGHNPRNAASKKLLMKLGFLYTGDEFYAPTGLYHPSYLLRNPAWENR